MSFTKSVAAGGILCVLMAGACSGAQTRRYGQISVNETTDRITMDTGSIQVSIGKADGLATCAWRGLVRVRGAHAGVQLGDLLETTSCSVHALSSSGFTPLADGFGKGLKLSVLNTAEGKPALRQV